MRLDVLRFSNWTRPAAALTPSAFAESEKGARMIARAIPPCFHNLPVEGTAAVCKTSMPITLTGIHPLTSI